jgi:hypothetical protein
MTMQSVFELSSLAVLPFWLTMILAPRWRGTMWLARSLLGVAAPIAAYAALVLPRLGEILPAVARPELGAVAALLGTPAGATVAWAHFLAFDLFVGRWIYLDARERGVSAWLMSPLLLLTLLLGPLGLAAYLIVRGGAGARLRALAGRARRGTRALVAKPPEGTRPLVVLAAASLGLLAASLVLMLVDGRQVLGASTWLKPAKFAASVAITAGTLAALLHFMTPVTRRMRRAAAVIAWLTGLELVLISLQAARGVASHFNAATTFDFVVFQVMGGSIVIVWLAIGYLGWRAFRTRFADRAFGWGIRLGFVTMMVGAGLGGLMPRPTATQLAELRAGHPTPAVGAHAVGVADGGPGLPITRWSTEGGDLRIPHFIGMHGLQLLPLLGLAVARRRRRQGTGGDGAGLVIVAGAGYLGLVGVTLLQALRGQPLLRPDAVTWTTAALVAAGTAVAAALVSSRAHRARGHETIAPRPWATA